MSARWRYLLDTNILSDLIPRPQGPIADRILRVGEDRICTSIIVAAELRYGALKSGSAPLNDRVSGLLASVDVLPLEPTPDQDYAEIRDHLTRTGQLIGPNDLLIAAQARSERLTVVTANLREIDRVPGLAVENWLA